MATLDISKTNEFQSYCFKAKFFNQRIKKLKKGSNKYL